MQCLYIILWCDCTKLKFMKNISMFSRNAKQVYIEWYVTISDEEIYNVFILREMIKINEGWTIWAIFNIGDVDLAINDLFVN